MAEQNIVRGRIEFEGIVQGVGFRPFLHKLAEELGLPGWVLNSSAGVLMELEGPQPVIEDYIRRVREDSPALSRVLVSRVRYLPIAGFEGFAIKPSHREEGELTLLCPDVALCADCRRELLDPADRRHGYPFINCTNCGPRYTIVRALPYDRPLTTMAGFPLCADCRREYEDVADRRYHAQPVACAACGPRLWFVDASGQQLPGDALTEAARRLREGEVLAIKGLGGFHLACRADRDEPVLTLRRRKRRSFFKPLAVMVPDLAAARQLCRIDAVAADWLASTVSPVVLLPLLPETAGTLISKYVAPRLDRLGLMLPYTPLHELLLRETDVPLVMTSGNLSDEPIVADNERAIAGLESLVDGLLLNNRPIHARCDDSVLSADADGSYTVFRHSRGFSPYPLALPEAGPSVLALGGDLKTTFAASRRNFVFLSPHLGDGEHLATYSFFRETWEHYRALFGITPEAVACDMHPGYHTGRWAAELAEEYGVPLIKVQHHHAHLAALIAEYNLDGEQLAIVADGTGYGADGTLWGGEVFCGDARDYQRIAHLRPILLPGGDAAVREPWRIALALINEAAPEYLDAYGDSLVNGALAANAEMFFPGRISAAVDPEAERPDAPAVSLVCGMLGSRTATAPSSALGRLLDGLAALLGICLRTTYEGQAPMELEALLSTTPEPPDQSVPPVVHADSIDWAPLVRAILAADAARVDPGRWAWIVHKWVAEAFMQAVAGHPAAARTGRILATGGCLQNATLRRLWREACQQAGWALLTPRDIPAGDGGLALGMLKVAQVKLSLI
ncbi:carbamoyltransferase HypF [bacterium]|nr:carbamoyltransferase HypF [bacterium]